MPIRPVKARSDRGSIKDISNDSDDNQPPSSLEIRMRDLYEYASAHKDESLKESLGFIVMNHPGDREALPITLIRHREYINSINQKSANKILQISKEIELCLQPVAEPVYIKRARAAILSDMGFIKSASADSYDISLRSFRRAR